MTAATFECQLAADYCPPAQWTAEHVEHRLVEALETIMAMDDPPGPGEYDRAWPGYADDWAVEVAAARAFWAGLATPEQTAIAAAMGSDEVKRVIEDTQEDARLCVSPPTMAQITRMEEAIGWVGKYLRSQPLWLVHAVQRVAWAKAIGRDAEWLSKKVGGPSGASWQDRALAGCAVIAWGLGRDRFPVF